MHEQLNSLIAGYEAGQISRRSLVGALVAMMSVPVAAAKEVAPGFSAKSLNHVSLAVSDVERSRQFYAKVLGIETKSTQENGINMGLGDSFLGLYKIGDSTGINHFCIGLDNYSVEDSARRLKAFDIEPLVRKDKPEVYFEDPDGILVQLESRHYRG